MSIRQMEFGKINGKTVYLYRLDNSNGLVAEIINYGGIIRTLEFKEIDVVLGRDSMEEYQNNSGYYGALIGRNSNRLENSEFEIDGVLYKLPANDGRNNLHGGPDAFNKKIWDAEAIDGEEPSLILTLISPDGDQGFPGEAKVRVTYTLTRDNAIKIHYEAECDKDTLMNLTNHSYFNLNGHSSGDICKHKLTMKSSFFTPNTTELMPYGEIIKTEGTPFDFTKGMLLEEGFSSDYEQIKNFNHGYDHNFILDGSGYRYTATLKGDKSGIRMDMYTDLPAVQIYTSNSADDRICKDGAVYPLHAGVCLETQVFPNAMKYRHYPGPLLRKGEKYDTTTEFKFY